MRLVPVKAAASRIRLRCVCHNIDHRETELYADLDGRPFVDYYCRESIGVGPGLMLYTSTLKREDSAEV